jgi:phosphoglycolate phosphatase
MTTPRLVIFDMDGTLVDSQHEIVAAMSMAFSAIGEPPPAREEVLAIVGLSLYEAMTVLVPDLPETVRFSLVEHYRKNFLVHQQRGGEPVPLYPGARDTLERLSADPWTILGVATGKARRGLDRIFAVHDLADYFATLQTADNHPSKPHPSMVLQALLETGCAPQDAVMVGDTEFDIAMGRSAGVRTIGVSWGYHPRERLVAAGADCVIDGYGELPSALTLVWNKAG